MKLLSRKTKLNLDKSKKYLLACSGGPDSMALFHMLYEQGFNFEVAFVNYQSRPESNQEEEQVRKICENCRVFAHILKKKCDYIGNFEAEARHIRYSFFEEIIKNDPSIYGVLVAHNADDNLETFFMQRERKNLPTFFGLAEEVVLNGINVIRPLLGYEKKFLTNYCTKNDVSFSIDKTNFDSKYLRNAIRISTISQMYKEEKNYILETIDLYNEYLVNLYKELDQFIEGNVLKTSRFFVQHKSKSEFYEGKANTLQRLVFHFIKKFTNVEVKSSIKNLLRDIMNDNLNVLFDNGDFYLIFDTEGLTFCKKDPRTVDYTYTKERFNEFGKCNIEENVVIRPLYLYEDYIMENGTHKKVNRFFIDCKIPLSLKYIWPCAVSIDTNEIIFVPRYRYNYVERDDAKLKFSAKTLQNLNIF